MTEVKQASQTVTALKTVAIVLTVLALLSTACCWSCVNVTNQGLCFYDKVQNLRLNGRATELPEADRGIEEDQDSGQCIGLTFWPGSEFQVEFDDSKGVSRQFTLQRAEDFSDSAGMWVEDGSLHVWGGYDVNPKKPVTLPVVRYD